jgi:hypothetical protein
VETISKTTVFLKFINTRTVVYVAYDRLQPPEAHQKLYAPTAVTLTAFLHRVYVESQNKKQLIPNNGEEWIVKAGVAAVHGGRSPRDDKLGSKMSTSKLN